MHLIFKATKKIKCCSKKNQITKFSEFEHAILSVTIKASLCLFALSYLLIIINTVIYYYYTIFREQCQYKGRNAIVLN